MEGIFIVLIGVVIFALIILALYLFSRSKGKLLIELDKYEFSPGETIKGKVTLKMKKPVDAKSLDVGLFAWKRSVSYLGGRRSSRVVQIFDFKKPLDGEKTYLGEKTYNFSLKVPTEVSSNVGGVAGTAIKSLQALTGGSSSIQWKIVSNLDMKGFDISKKVRINVA